jgi:EpsI family protein
VSGINARDGGLDRRAFLIGGGMLAAAGGAAARIPQPNSPAVAQKRFEAMMPDTVGAWRFQQSSGLVLPPEDALSARLYDNLITRVYTDRSGTAMMLLIAYKNFQNGVLQLHRPEICYPAGGYQLSPTLPVEIAVGGGRTMPANSFSAVGNERDEQVLYWTRIGEHFPVRWIEQRLAVFRANLAGVNPDGMLARISMVNDDMAFSRPKMEQFVTALRSASAPPLRQLLFGRLA